MNVIRHMRHSQFLRHNTVFFFGSVAVGALNYIYYPVLGRLLTPSAFGEVQTLVSLFLQLGIFLSVISLVTITIVANYQDEAERNTLVLEFERLALGISIFFLLTTILLQAPLQSFLHFHSSWPFILLALSIVATVPFTMRSAFLRGKQRFGLASIGNLLGAGGKLLFAVIFVAIGLGTAGAIGGLVAAQLVACLFVAWWAYHLGLHRTSSDTWFRLPDFKALLPELKYGALVLVASLAITLQYSIDIIVVKHYFNAHIAGLYAGIASVARIIFFLTASISQVLMPSVRRVASPQENRQFLVASLALFAGLAIPVLMIFMIFPNTITQVLMGATYIGLAHVLPELSLAIFIISIINLLVIYYVALRRYSIAVITSLGVLVTTVLMALHHTEVGDIVTALLVGSMTMLVMIVLWRIFQAVQSKKKGGA